MKFSGIFLMLALAMVAAADRCSLMFNGIALNPWTRGWMSGQIRINDVVVCTLPPNISRNDLLHDVNKVYWFDCPNDVYAFYGTNNGRRGEFVVAFAWRNRNYRYPVIETSDRRGRYNLHAGGSCAAEDGFPSQMGN